MDCGIRGGGEEVRHQRYRARRTTQQTWILNDVIYVYDHMLTISKICLHAFKSRHAAHACTLAVESLHRISQYTIKKVQTERRMRSLCQIEREESLSYTLIFHLHCTQATLRHVQESNTASPFPGIFQLQRQETSTAASSSGPRCTL
jgi:hypothetical protein